MNKLMSSSGWIPIVSSILLLAFWISFAVFLPMEKEYIYWVLDDDWTWINVIGFSGSLLGIFSIITVFYFKHIKNIQDYFACALSIVGIVFLTSILFFETFILKGIALVSPGLVDLNTGFYQNIVFQFANLLGGVLFSTGIVFLAVFMIKERTFKRWSLISLLIGAPLFGIMLMPGNVRILGVLFYSVGFIAIGFEILSRKRVGRI